jgi:hypothetical protein
MKENFFSAQGKEEKREKEERYIIDDSGCL